jgi:uncharacterized membrane protein
MIENGFSFASLLMAALVVGAMFGVWLVFDPSGLDAATYISQQQLSIRKLNHVMPVLGGVTILLTLVTAILARHDPARCATLIIAMLCIAAAGLITRFVNQPINAKVIAWQPSAPPLDWTILRDAWWRWHNVRLVSGLAGLSLLIVAMLARGNLSA